MDGTGVPVPEHLWFVGQVPDLPLLQNLSMAGREPAPQPSPNGETPDTGRNCFLRGDDRLRRSRTVPQRGGKLAKTRRGRGAVITKSGRVAFPPRSSSSRSPLGLV